MSDIPESLRAELVGAFGDPIDENPTGIMQEAAFAAAGLNWRYLLLKVRREDLAAALAGIRALNFRGINLTIPHKVAVLQHLDRIAPDAALIGAVNTVAREGDALIGHNTDGGFCVHCEDAGLTGRQAFRLPGQAAQRWMTIEVRGWRQPSRSSTARWSGSDLAEHLAAAHRQTAFVHWRDGYSVPRTPMCWSTPLPSFYPDVDAISAVALIPSVRGCWSAT
jgi:shikimate dehydrogenase